MTKREVTQHHSSYISNCLTHRFISDVCLALWKIDYTKKLQIYNSDVDDEGFDLVLGVGDVLRYIQLKASHSLSTTKSITVRHSFASMPGSCVVWILYDLETLAPTAYQWFGYGYGEKMPDITDFPVPSRQRRDRDGAKVARSHYRTIDKRYFIPLASPNAICQALFHIKKG